ncbi:ATP-binding protein [uncultured Desulfobacter sp.]|uniref:sensor histidine kinase n=1 Tax=uncultured Desulfobacter sp. TaxID=240139 RepID=UPI002AAB7B0D|nr:ATP-binding protein [uncultured Desulfobacter sp.]
MSKRSFSIRTKLIVIFVLIKVLPLVALAWFSRSVIFDLADTLKKQAQKVAQNTNVLVGGIADMATNNSIKALDDRSREAIERLTTDTAWHVANFLYDRDVDIRLAAQITPGKKAYQGFLCGHIRKVVVDDGKWKMNEDGTKWIPVDPAPEPHQEVTARIEDNSNQFHYRPQDTPGVIVDRPLYVEMTYVDLSGMEKIKVSQGWRTSETLLDVSKKENTFCKAETYFESLKKLKPGQIYVSDVIGAYVKGFLPGGVYNRVRAEKAGIAFEPQNSGYAGFENPLGIRFKGLVRWATPVVVKGEITGYVTLALDHTHIMEFTDHVVPTDARYCITPDAGTGNYAFMWDYKGRNISHPRDYFIVGYDPETGQQAVPWLEASLYPTWLLCNGSMSEFEAKVPWFDAQSLKKKPAQELTQQGFVGLDGRFLNFAPQCTGWHTLTQYGGSGSFLIFWSKLWKLTTAGAIPYYTGQYGEHPRGFGYVTIGANVDEFHKPAVQTAASITSIRKNFEENLTTQKEYNQAYLRRTLHDTSLKMILSTAAMILVVILIALWMAAVLTGKITRMIRGINHFQDGDMDFRLEETSNDEIGQLASSFNNMADSIQQNLMEIEKNQKATERANDLLKQEVIERKAAQVELSLHRDHLEVMVEKRTAQLEAQIQERERAEKELIQSEKMAILGQLIAGIAHEINTPMGAIKSSGSNISDFLEKFQKDMPGLVEKLGNQYLPLFFTLLEQALQKKTVFRTSREERKMIRTLNDMLNEAGIDGGRQMAFFLVQMNVYDQWERFKPILLHPESEFILETAYSIHSITSNTTNIIQAVDRVSKIIYALKSYIRQGEANEKVKTDIIESIETVLTIYHNQIKQNIELVREYETIESIPGYTDELGQVWTNLIYNALQAMAYKGTLTIQVKNKDDHVCISVSDTGCGIPEENREKIFQPFFTTKKRGEGSGLGLDIVARIIKKHDGQINLESEVGKGTTFTVLLPRNGD